MPKTVKSKKVMHLLLKSEVPVVEPEPDTFMEGEEVIIIDCPYSCVAINSRGVIESHLPDHRGYAVTVKTFHTGLFGGGTYSSGGTYFFQYEQVIRATDEQDSGDTSSVKS
jgi:hypothetical protein